jgi:Zn-dependent protease with chaperone function
MRGRRSGLRWLVAIGLVGAANGFFIGYGLATLLAVAVHILEQAPPPSAVGPIAGVCLALGVIVIALLRERSLAEGEVPSWLLEPPRTALEAELDATVAELAETAGMSERPRVRLVQGIAPNAFVLGDVGGSGAAILVTEPTLERLTAAELRAVLAQELAHFEAGDLRAVALADAIQATVAYLGAFKGRYIWGTGDIFRRSLPLMACLALLALVIHLLPRETAETIETVTGIGLLVVFYISWEFGRRWEASITKAGRRFLVATFQFGLWLGLLGPLSLAEAVLAWPTVIFLSRLLSRKRVYAADARAVALTGDKEALRGALAALAPVEEVPVGGGFDHLRFSLFATPRASTRYRAMVERLTGTHPSAEQRIAHLG